MTIPGGLLSSLLTQGVNAAGAYQGAKREASQLQLQQALQAMMMQRQLQQFQTDQALKQSQMGYYQGRGNEANAIANRRTRVPITVAGKPMLAFSDNDGNLFDDQGNLIKGDVEPYHAPAATKNPSEIPGTPEWQQAERFKASLHPEPQQIFTPFQGTDANGKPVVRPFNTKSGQFGPPADVMPKAASANIAGPIAAKVGQFGELLKKASDLMPATEALNVSLAQSGAQDVAANGVGVGHARLPGTTGLGALMVNRTPEYSRYQAALSPYILAAAHALSGARINDTQIAQIRSSIEIKPGDSQPVRQQKMKNLMDLTNSIGGSLPQDAIAQQESQMDPQALQMLRGYGYKGTTGAPSPQTAGPMAPKAAKPKADHGIFGSGD